MILDEWITVLSYLRDHPRKDLGRFSAIVSDPDGNVHILHDEGDTEDLLELPREYVIGVVSEGEPVVLED